MPVSRLPPNALSSVFAPLSRRAAKPLGDRCSDAEITTRMEPPVGPPRRRTAIWDMHNSLHCSIVGTCLSTEELRRVAVHVKAPGAATAGDHDLHMLGVMLAGRPRAGAKLLQKTLDRRHAAAIRQADRLKDPAALIAYWEEALKRGDIPGAYWAVLTHPAASDDTVRQAFGDVHMLSHLVGAANRADIRRLRALEAEAAALNVRLERQQRQLRDGFLARDATISELKAALARALAQQPSTADDARLAREAVCDLETRLDRAIGRRERAEARLAVAGEALRAAVKAGERATRQRAALLRELAAVEARLEGLLAGAPGTAGLDLGGLRVLYVGGRANQVAPLKALAERAGAVFAHHDGGIEHSPVLLAGLIGRADAVLFPIDCISHGAAAAIKRQCRQAAKRYVPLRTASLASCLSGLVRLCEAAPSTVADLRP